MKNKLLIILIAIMVMLCGTLTFTACGEDKVSLTSEELKQAIEATLNAKNAKIHATAGFFDNDEYTWDYTFYYDDINGVCKYETGGELAGYIVMGKDWVYDFRVQDEGWDTQGTDADSIGKYINTFADCCLFKAKDDDSFQFVSFEETYASFKYDSKTDTYKSALLSKGKNAVDTSAWELEVSLTVDNGYVTKIQIITNNESGNAEVEYENYIYSDFGTVEITIPDEVMELFQQKEQKK